MVRLIVTLLFIPFICGRSLAQERPQNAGDMYRQWCAVCHGANGNGDMPSRPVRTEPLDFSDCAVSTREPDADWELVIRRGGPAAGLSWDMPAFHDTLTAEEMSRMLRHLRSLCAERRWPHGNLNLPRGLFTTKAFPGDEVVIVPMVSHRYGARTRVRIHHEYERRLGRRGQFEATLPIESVGGPRRRVIGFGDVSVGAKYVLHSNEAGTRILTAGFETHLPTGPTRYQFGEGSAAFEPFVAAALRRRSLHLQLDFAMEQLARRVSPEHPLRHVIYNAYAAGELRPLPGSLTVGLEINGLDKNVAVTPQIRKALTRTGALAAAFGVRIPVYSYPGVQFTRWTGYLLWDYRDPIMARSSAPRQ